MLRTLLAKDLRRTWRNPIPWLILIAIPFATTGIIGLVFGGGCGDVQVQIKVAVVDEDDSPLTRLLRGSMNQREARERLDLQFLGREEALRRVTSNEFAAAVIIPKGFTSDYVKRERPVALQVVKNPAQGVPPAVVQEGLALIVSALNALSRIAGDQLSGWSAALTQADNREFLDQLAAWSNLLVQTRNLVEPVKDYLSPPLVVYTKNTKESGHAESRTTSARGGFADLFGFLLIGLAAMFLLMLADNSMRDLYREMRFRTLERFSTLREGLTVFVAAKVVFTLAILLVGSAILFGGGGLIFGIGWKRLPEFVLLIVTYAFFAAGFMGLIAALAGEERRADLFNTVVVLGLSLAGGCMFPPEVFPPVWRDHVMPFLPTAWFASAARALQRDGATTEWIRSATLLAGFGVLTIVIAGRLFQVRLQKGMRP